MFCLLVKTPTKAKDTLSGVGFFGMTTRKARPSGFGSFIIHIKIPASEFHRSSDEMQVVGSMRTVTHQTAFSFFSAYMQPVQVIFSVTETGGPL